ncbi:hypothetical protein ABDK56_01120 [Sphingomonas sp. ASV193]|uniref:COG3650 family protein n=1 Tax=Sphingomonas sp. ASV193 TaxID=3144405 RepID=UPI0032E8B021
MRRLLLLAPLLLGACAYDNQPIPGGPFPNGPYGNGAYPAGSVTYPPAPPAMPPYDSDVFGQEPYRATPYPPVAPTNPYVPYPVPDADSPYGQQAPVAAGPTIYSGQGPYRAAGTEPFWDLTIGGDMTFTDRGRNIVVSAPTPAPRTGTDSEIWQTPRLVVSVTHQSCSDGMSDKRYPDTVRVSADGRLYKGCGGVPATGYVSY